jgi:hypothetical protein
LNLALDVARKIGIPEAEKIEAFMQKNGLTFDEPA